METRRGACVSSFNFASCRCYATEQLAKCLTRARNDERVTCSK
jgi:hypothetical protein